MSMLKNGSALARSTSCSSIRATLPAIAGARCRRSCKVELLFDQSLFVRAALSTACVKEALIAAGLTALMILLFLGSWRSTLIVASRSRSRSSSSIIVLGALGQTLNVMTLGGLALAVGILVDDATVGDREHPPQPGHAESRSCARSSTARSRSRCRRSSSTLCICIVFVPVVFITGAAKSLFVPLAMAVVFAMLTSYFLSRTLVPTLVQYAARAARRAASRARATGLRSGASARFDRGFERLRDALRRAARAGRSRTADA